MSIKDKITHICNCLFVPTSIKPIKFALLLENLLCIYRNLGYYKKKYRIMIYIRMIMEITLTTACIAMYSVRLLPITSNLNAIYFYTTSISSIIIMLLACHSSGTFQKVILLVEGNNLYFANDQEYQRNMSKREAGIKIGMFICNFLFILDIVSKYVQMGIIDGVTQNILNVIFTLNARVCDWRCTYQYVVLYCFLYVISEQIDCITRAVSKKRVSVATVTEQRGATARNITDESSSESRIVIKEFEELSTVFINIKECCKLFNKIYGLQLVLMLGLSTTYCIMFMYTMAFLSVKGYHSVGSLIKSILKLVMYFLLLLLLSYGAQKKLNSVNRLRRQLGKLLIVYITNNAHYKATKDFLHLVSPRSIITETLGSIQVNMTLIPSFIMFVTSYTVIALQFNNIV